MVYSAACWLGRGPAELVPRAPQGAHPGPRVNSLAWVLLSVFFVLFPPFPLGWYADFECRCLLKASHG